MWKVAAPVALLVLGAAGAGAWGLFGGSSESEACLRIAKQAEAAKGTNNLAAVRQHLGKARAAGCSKGMIADLNGKVRALAETLAKEAEKRAEALRLECAENSRKMWSIAARKPPKPEEIFPILIRYVKKKCPNIEKHQALYNRVLGRSYIEKRNYLEALRHFKIAQSMKNTLIGRQLIGHALLELNRCREAIPHFNYYISRNSSYYGTYNMRGRCYVKQQQYSKALKEFNKALELRPNGFSSLEKRALLYMAISKYRLAIQDWNQLIGQRPKVDVLYTNRGICFHNLKNYRAAVSDYRQALKLNPRSADARQNLRLLGHRR